MTERDAKDRHLLGSACVGGASERRGDVGDELPNDLQLTTVAVIQQGRDLRPQVLTVLLPVIQLHHIFNGDVIDLIDLEKLPEADGLHSALDHPPVLAVFVERLTELLPCQVHALTDLAQLCGDLRQARIGNFSA